jgi:hypothetical protein
VLKGKADGGVVHEWLIGNVFGVDLMLQADRQTR